MARNILITLWHYLLTKYIRRFNSRSHLLDWQNQQVRSFLTRVLPKSQFYRDHYRSLDIRDWQQFPIIDKSVMMANFDQLNTVGISKQAGFALAIKAEKSRDFSSTIQGYTIGLSSGTSGNRGLFIVSQLEQQAWAGTILAKALPRFILTPQRIAFFLRANSNLYETIKGQRIQFEFFDLFADFESHIDRLNQVMPSILVAPPSMLRMLVNAQLRGDLRIYPIKIISVAEVLDPLDEGYIHAGFGQIVHQLYQCTEGFLGSTCEYGTLHLNEDILVVQKEYIDQEAGKFMPIITDFNRTTQPIIRYRLDDILTESRVPCGCGSVLTALDRIEGRQDDIFWLPNFTRERLIPIFPDFIGRAIMIVSDDIQEYRAVQKNPDLIEVFLMLTAESQNSVRHMVHKSLVNLFERSHCSIPKIIFLEYEVRTAHHQKLQRIHREFNLDQKL